VARTGILDGDLHPLQRQEVNEELLYHYTSATTLAKILDSGQIRLGPYARTNDPREQKEWIPRFTMPTGPGRPPERYLSSTPEEVEAAFRATDRYLRRGARLACFTLDRPRADDATAGTLFHRGWARARMWEQYAAHHAGACLVFDRQKLIELVDNHRPHGDGDLFTYGTVTYLDHALTVPLPWIDVVDQGIEAVLDDFQIRKDAARHLYTTKNTDWESEQEFRIVYVEWHVSEEAIDTPISIPFEGSLEAIVLGEAFPETEHNVMEFRSGMPAGLDVLQCQWHSGVPILAG
jgi:hypothetical protein